MIGKRQPVALRIGKNAKGNRFTNVKVIGAVDIEGQDNTFVNTTFHKIKKAPKEHPIISFITFVSAVLGIIGFFLGLLT